MCIAHRTNARSQLEKIAHQIGWRAVVPIAVLAQANCIIHPYLQYTHDFSFSPFAVSFWSWFICVFVPLFCVACFVAFARSIDSYSGEHNKKKKAIYERYTLWLWLYFRTVNQLALRPCPSQRVQSCRSSLQSTRLFDIKWTFEKVRCRALIQSIQVICVFHPFVSFILHINAMMGYLAVGNSER